MSRAKKTVPCRDGYHDKMASAALTQHLAPNKAAGIGERVTLESL
ncbi:hypothetical protein [Noviherbaspirillum saxi]|nr:hypothetical protein [Noviherbaspirillum saxi]